MIDLTLAITLGLVSPLLVCSIWRGFVQLRSQRKWTLNATYFTVQSVFCLSFAAEQVSRSECGKGGFVYALFHRLHIWMYLFLWSILIVYWSRLAFSISPRSRAWQKVMVFVVILGYGVYSTAYVVWFAVTGTPEGRNQTMHPPGRWDPGNCSNIQYVTSRGSNRSIFVFDEVNWRAMNPPSTFCLYPLDDARQRWWINSTTGAWSKCAWQNYQVGWRPRALGACGRVWAASAGARRWQCVFSGSVWCAGGVVCRCGTWSCGHRRLLIPAGVATATHTATCGL